MFLKYSRSFKNDKWKLIYSIVVGFELLPAIVRAVYHTHVVELIFFSLNCCGLQIWIPSKMYSLKLRKPSNNLLSTTYLYNLSMKNNNVAVFGYNAVFRFTSSIILIIIMDFWCSSKNFSYHWFFGMPQKQCKR